MNYRDLVDTIEQAGSFHVSNLMLIALDLEVRSDALEEIITSMSNKDFNSMFPDIASKEWFEDVEDMDKDEIMQTLIDSDKLGFIAEIGVHQRSGFSFDEKDGHVRSCSVHPGTSYVKYAYGDTIDDLVKSIESHCDEMEKYDIKKHKEKEEKI